MDTLVALVKLLSKQKLKQIEIITEDVKLSSKTKLLYDGILNGEFNDDDEAARKIYDSNSKNSSYKKLKYRLTQRLLNTLFFIDIQSYSKSEYQKALNRSFKNWAAAKILQDKGQNKVSIELFEQILKTSIKYDIIELSLLILKDLRLAYGLFIDNKYKFEKHSKKYTEIKHIYDLKDQAEYYYIYFGQLISKSKAYDFDTHVQKHLEEVEVLRKSVEDIDSFYLRYYTYNASYFGYLVKKDLDMQILVAKRAINYFQEKEGFKKIGLFSFTQKIGISYLSKKNYIKAMECFKYCMEFKLPEGSLPWMYVRSYFFQIHILRKDYNSAYSLISDVTNNKSFTKINETYREPWYLKEAFIHFLIKIGKVNIEDSDAQKLRPFRLARFMNEVSTFSNDKRGLNITINIIQMLFYIVDERFDDALDKLSSLRQYNFRYLKRPEYARFNNFIKMLLKIPEGDYEPAKIRAKAKKHYQALLDNPSDFSEHALSIEIIPYEQLWEEIMSIF